MLTTITRALQWADEKFENLLTDLAANYARELLASHGLVELEIDHIRRKFQLEPAVAPSENDKINRSISSQDATLSRSKIVPIETMVDSMKDVELLRTPTTHYDLWTGPETLAALCVAGAAIVALLFCLAAILKS
jgi:hypothetical protein